MTVYASASAPPYIVDLGATVNLVQPQPTGDWSSPLTAGRVLASAWGPGVDGPWYVRERGAGTAVTVADRTAALVRLAEIGRGGRREAGWAA